MLIMRQPFIPSPYQHCYCHQDVMIPDTEHTNPVSTAILLFAHQTLLPGSCDTSYGTGKGDSTGDYSYSIKQLQVPGT